MKLLLLIFLTHTLYPHSLETTNKNLDFWLGKWALEWEGGSGTNTISKILNDKIIQEEFIVLEGNPANYKGLSFSAFDKKTQQWKQTWVDSGGGYLDFTGGKEGDRMILSREAIDGNGNPFFQRMVFFNIEKDKLEWEWQRSNDGVEWQTQWHIKYKRIE